MTEATKDSQASTEESEEEKAAAKAAETKDKLYPEGENKEEETPEEKEIRETKEEEKKEEVKVLSDRADKAGLKSDATEEEVVAAEKKIEETKKEEEVKLSVAELQDSAQKAIEKWQANPTPENKKEADKAVEASKKAVDDAKNAEIKYDIKLSENSLLPKERTEEIVAYARERGFSNEVAQSMVEMQEKATQHQREEAAKQVDEVVNVQWPKSASEDKEIGGDKFGENAELAKRVLAKFGSPAFVNLLNPKSKENPEGTGYGNNPELLRFAVRIGKSMSDDQLLLPKGKAPEEKSIAETFYGGTKKKE